ncbi:hypothetical protein [Streptomyces sp. NPDC003006]
MLAGKAPVFVHNSNCPPASKYEDITSPGARMLNKSAEASSYKGWTADYYNPGSKKADIKIRLGKDQ